MTKKIITSIFLFSSIVRADIIKCTFTEPFIDTSYSMAQATLTSKDSEGSIRVVKNVSFQIKSAGVFELVSKSGTVLQKLILSNKGSDGMSEKMYPYEVKEARRLMSGSKGRGG